MSHATFKNFCFSNITFDHIKLNFIVISDQCTILFCFTLYTKWPPAAILDDRKSLSIAFLAILDQYATFYFFEMFSQNGRRQPFWMTENHFRSHFSPFQINTQLLFCLKFFTKWPLAAILDDRKSLSIAFLAISDQNAAFLLFFLIFFSKMAASGHFRFRVLPKSIGTSLYSMSVATSNMNLIGAFFIKL